MARPPRPWTVTPHSPLEKLDDNLWALSSHIPGMGGGHRRMSIVRRTDGKLVFFNGVPMDDATRQEIEAWGKPAYLVVTHDGHCIDAEAFRTALGLKVYGPRKCETAVRGRVTLEGTLDALPPDASHSIEELTCTKQGEPVLTVKSAGGTALVFSDVFQNGDPKTLGLMFRILGFAGPRTPPVFKRMFVEDKPALKARFEAWASTPGLKRVVPSHGLVIEAGAAETLRAAGRAL